MTAQSRRNKVKVFFLLGLFALLALILYHELMSVDYQEESKLDYSEYTANLDKARRDEVEAKCQTIHLAIVCGGFNSTRSFYVLLKSILFYRTDIINLHLFVDNISHAILDALFKTWTVPDLHVNFYNLTEYENRISWIPSQHYSHRFGLMKLVFLSVLADQLSLNNAILLDTDMLVLGNINRLWQEIQHMNTDDDSGPALGLVENQSDWYLGEKQPTGNPNVWPAIGRGFNSGLILVNLIRLKRYNWQQLWRQVAESELATQLSTPLADQDIFNAVIRSHSYLIYPLECTFNLQLNEHSRMNEMCRGSSDLKIIHWNSPYKFSSRNPHAQLYKNWYLTFTNWDGKLLEQSSCNKAPVSDSKTSASLPSSLEVVCNDIQPRPGDKLRTYLYFLEFENVPTKCDVTLVVHLSLDRLQVLDELANHWLGPISAAIYLSELETTLLSELINNSHNLASRMNIGYHLVFKDHGFNYPINRLRNIALDNAITPYVFLSDVDFLPSKNLYEYLKQTISEMSGQEGNIDPLEKRALVIPAFENLQYKFEFPSNKAELLTQLNLGAVSIFREQIWPKGQAPTNYLKWRSSTKPYKVDWRPEYEPFIVTSRATPRFDERFVGFGWNKVEHIVLLAALDYEFLVLPEAFLIHKFHSASFDIMRHRESSDYRTCIKTLKRVFLAELRKKYPDFFAKI